MVTRPVRRHWSLALLLVTCPAIIRSQGTSASRQVVIATPRDTVAQYDTLSGVMVHFLPSGTAKEQMSWQTYPAGYLSVGRVDPFGHMVRFIGKRPGRTWVVASWIVLTGRRLTVGGVTRSEVLFVQDSVLITVTSPVHTVSPFNSVVNGKGIFNPALVDSVCTFPQEMDKAGTYYTGKSYTWASNDTLWARRANSSACPDTASRPSFLTLPLPKLPRP